MKSKRMIGILICLCGLLATAQAAEPPERALWSQDGRGQTVSLSSLVDLNDKSFDLSAESPLLLMHFWATWCEPCIDEFPRLNRFAARVAPRKVTVIAVSEDRGGASDVRAFFEKNEGSQGLRLLVDPGRKVARMLGVSVLPTTILIKNGREMSRAVGSVQWDDDDFNRLSDDIGRLSDDIGRLSDDIGN